MTELRLSLQHKMPFGNGSLLEFALILLLFLEHSQHRPSYENKGMILSKVAWVNYLSN